jgi:hypothetical protein
MHNCPPADRWSIAVWQGASGTAAGDALAACGAGSVAAAYSLDSQTGAWSRWFAGKPDVSNLPPLSDMQGVLVLGGTAMVGAAGEERLATAQTLGQLHNCPPVGKWSIAVWEGDSGAAADAALATCGAGKVAAAYSLDPQTAGWSRWFAGKPDVSNLPPLSDLQGVLALGAAGGPVVTATPAGTPTPGTGDVTLVSTNAFTTSSSLRIDGEPRELTVVGELRNDGPSNRSVGDITIRFYDAANQEVGHRWTWAFDDIIRPGRTTAFEESTPSMLYSDNETNNYPEGWTRYEIELSPADPYEWEDEPVDVAVENVQISDGGHHVTGNVVNNSSKTIPANGATAYAIYYRADGTILNAECDCFLNNSPIPPGGKASFDVPFFLTDEPVDFSSYVVQAYAEAE